MNCLVKINKNVADLNDMGNIFLDVTDNLLQKFA